MTREKLLSNKPSFPFICHVSRSALTWTAAVRDVWQDLTPSNHQPGPSCRLLTGACWQMTGLESYFNNSTSRAFAPSVAVNWYPKEPEIETLYLLLEFPSSLNSLGKHNYHLKAEETGARRDQGRTFTEAPRFISINYKDLCKLFFPSMQFSDRI